MNNTTQLNQTLGTRLSEHEREKLLQQNPDPLIWAFTAEAIVYIVWNEYRVLPVWHWWTKSHIFGSWHLIYLDLFSIAGPAKHRLKTRTSEILNPLFWNYIPKIPAKLTRFKVQHLFFVLWQTRMRAPWRTKYWKTRQNCLWPVFRPSVLFCVAGIPRGLHGLRRNIWDPTPEAMPDSKNGFKNENPTPRMPCAISGGFIRGTEEVIAFTFNYRHTTNGWWPSGASRVATR